MPRQDDSAPSPAPLDISPEELALAVQVVRLLRRIGLADPTPAAANHSGRQLVRLDQLAAIVNRSKRTLEKYVNRRPAAGHDPMPAAVIEGGGGKPALWDYAECREWLMKTFQFHRLPERFPELSNRGPRP
jgi:hypothetical protein